MRFEENTNRLWDALRRKVRAMDPNRTEPDMLDECMRRGIKAWQEEMLASRENEKAIRDVFEFWMTTFAKKKVVYTDHRKRVVRARLREGYRVQDLKDAIVGATQSEYHVQNGYTDLATILRTPMTVDQHLARFRGEVRTHHGMAQSQFDEKPLSSLFSNE